MRALCLPIILSYVGLAFFLYGFFLTRRELNLKASVETFHTNICALHLRSDHVVSPNSILNAPPSRNHMESIKNPPPKKVFLFIVDALRLDFMTRKEGSTEPHSPYNRFQNMHRLLEQNASQSLLFGFRADPPTVTSQRLKSLTTGSLPTFIDIGANMNSSAITEDNFIDQLLSRSTLKNSQSSSVCNTTTGSNTDSSSTSSNDINNQNTNTTCPNPKPFLIVLGDDTWGSLYPTQFTITHYYDSFNTRDLDSVDQGIISHLFDYLPCGNNLSAPIRNISDHSQRTDIVQNKECEESNQPEWDLMIAHFLGVDHIGHTHHAFHPLMAARLALMDELLLQVIERLPPNSVLFLFGDHGMTDQGEHGGSTSHETDSGLFVYSTEPIFTVHEGSGTNNYTDINSDTYECKNDAADSNTPNGTCATTLYWNDTAQTFVHTFVQTILTNPRVVPQIDFTPTISTLLGVPIPASSLGKIIPELFINNYMDNIVESGTNSSGTRILNNSGDNNVNKCCEKDRLLNLYFTNAMQVWRYLSAYWSKDPVTTYSIATISNDRPSVLNISHSIELLQLSDSTHVELVYLEELLLQAIQAHLQYVQLCAAQIDTTCRNNTTIAADINGVYAKYVHFLTEVQSFTRHKWTQFKMVPMLIGLTLLVCALLLFTHRAYLTISGTYKTTAAMANRPDGTTPKVRTICIPTSWQSLYTLVCNTMHTLYSVRPAILFVVPAGVVFHSLAALSNNFTEQEHWTIFGLVLACTVSLASQLWYIPLPKDQTGDRLKQSRKKSILLLFLTLSTLGVCLIWQYGPHSTYSTNNQVQLSLWLHSVVPGSVYNTIGNAIVCGSIIVLLLLYMRCINCLTIGSKRYVSFGDTCMQCNNIFIGVCVVSYWAVKYKVFIIDLDIFPSVLLWCANHPLCSHLCAVDWLIMLPRSVILLCTSNTICALNNTYTTTSPTHINDVNVYHHHHTFVNLVHAIVSFVLLLGLMLGPVGCACIVLCLIQSIVFVYCYVHIVCTTRVHVGRSGYVTTVTCDDTKEQTTEESALSATDLTQLFMCIMLAAYFPLMGRFLYFVTGHRMDFGTLQLWSGFIGSHTFEFYYAGMCLAINTFGSFVLYVLCLYAAVVYLRVAATTDKTSHVESRELNERSTSFSTMSSYVHSVLCISITYQCSIMCVSCIGAAILRRHLMVWAVFAPKMAFEACIWLSVSLTALVVESVLTM